MLPFTTARLLGHPACDDDFASLRILHEDPRVMATLAPDGRPRDAQFTRAMLARMRSHWERHDFGVWMLTRAEDGIFTGYAGLQHLQIDGAAEIEVMYAIRADLWRRGYASEAAAASLSYGFATLGAASLVAITLVNNHGSRAVMEHCAMRYERDIEHAELPHVLYRITAAEFGGANVGGHA